MKPQIKISSLEAVSSSISRNSSKSGRLTRVQVVVVAGLIMFGCAAPFAGAEQPATRPSSNLPQQPQPLLFPRIEFVLSGSAAEHGGFQPGDQIIAYDGHATAVPDHRSFCNVVLSAKGHTSEVIILRNGRAMKLAAGVPDGQLLGIDFSLQQLGSAPSPAGQSPAQATASNALSNLDRAVRIGRLVRKLDEAGKAVTAAEPTIPAEVPIPAPPAEITEPVPPEIPIPLPPAELPVPVPPVIEPVEDVDIVESVIEFILQIFGL